MCLGKVLILKNGMGSWRDEGRREVELVSFINCPLRRCGDARSNECAQKHSYSSKGTLCHSREKMTNETARREMKILNSN